MLRARGFSSWGDNPDFTYFGGNAELRGYDYLSFAGLGGASFDGVPFKFFSSSDSIERPVVGLNSDLSPILGNPVTVRGRRLVDGRASYGVSLATFALGLPAHLDWSWKTLLNKQWEDIVFAQSGGSAAFRKPKFTFWIGYDF